jgi:hypothetical protein
LSLPSPFAPARIAVVALLCVLAFAAAACDRGEAKPSTPIAETATPRALPPPVAISPEAQGVQLADPAFDALPGAKADYGRLGGTVYQIEVPDDWNGRLFMYQHGFQSLAPKAEVQQPLLREYFVEHGWAWAASSFSSTSLIPGRAADETAALWDYFAGKYGRPAHTYVGGDSMGGAATNIAAERYGDRYDGALSMCSFAGQSAQTQIVDDYFFAAAYVAGITQADFDASTDYPKMINERIVPALADPAKHAEFEDIIIGLTGGERPFDHLGIHLEEKTNWFRSGILVAARLGTNIGRTYTFAPGTTVSSDDFNRGVIRMAVDESRRDDFERGNEITGALQMPMLTLHTTGDWQVPIDQEQILRRDVDAAGKGDLLVQRVIAAPQHCGFTESEEERALEDLVGWVEEGTKPRGDDVLQADLTRAGSQFTLAERFGSDVSMRVPGAADRVTVHGAVTFDGKAADDGAFMWIEVRDGGLANACSFEGEPVSGGRYERVVAADTEVRGCGRPGAMVYAVTFAGDHLTYSAPAAWPADGHDLTLDADFARDASPAADERVTPIFGAVRSADGSRLPPGTVVEALAGDAICARAAIPPVIMQFSQPDEFGLLAVGPDATPGCVQDAALRFRVNGKLVDGAITNDLRLSSHRMDLVVK